MKRFGKALENYKELNGRVSLVTAIVVVKATVWAEHVKNVALWQ